MCRCKSRRRAAVFAATAVALCAAHANAVTKTWTNTNGLEDWSTASNWSPTGSPGSGDDAVLPAGFPNADASQPISITTALCNSLTLADSYTLNGGTLSVGGTGAIDVAASKSANLGSSLTGSAGLTKNGAGTLTLSSSNSFSGGATIAAGTLSLAHGSALGTNSTTIQSATLEIANVTIANTLFAQNGATIRGTGSPGEAGETRVAAGAAITFSTGASPSDSFAMGSIRDGGGGANINVNGAGMIIITATSLNPAERYVGGWNVASGTLRFSINEQLGNPANVVTLSGGTLEVTGLANASTRNISVSASGGNLSATGNASLGNVDGIGALTKAGAGTLTVNHVRTNGLSVSTGTLAIAAGAGNAGTSKTTTVGAASKLDLKDSKLIVTSQSLASVEALITSGRNGGSWNGNGILTSQPAALTAVNTLGVSTAQQANKTTFGGMSVSSGNVLVMYTYAGDADLSGLIDGDDFAAIDAGFAGSLAGYANGDFNYSGTIDADDYFLLDRNYSRNLPQLSASAPVGVTSVPEPTGGALVAAGAPFLLRRRRRA